MAEREQRLTNIFHSAIERQGAERRAFLDGACGADEELRREVESLIRSHEQAGSIIDSPAYARKAELLNNQTPASFVGRTLGQYRLVSLVGTGGMGEVYLADDTRLDRQVAIKILTANFTADAAQVGRFQQEARAASALNHPNIITVYDINESDGTQYIATEFIEGETLRTRVASNPPSLNEALDIAIQIASALSAAHGAGVVHRDVKPENVMLRPDGYVKVVDFGIAKLTEVRRPSPDAEAPTRALVKTGKGVVMGTAHYMSPEQARGQTVDARTDIWSLGVVLYEMVAGRVPFEGDTASDCIASILKTEPQTLSEIRSYVPARLDWLVQKALRKDADERYQRAKELLSDLRAVKQEVETRAHALRSSQQAAVSSGAQAAATTTDDNSLSPTAAVVRTSSSAEYLVSEIKRHKRGVFMVLALVVAAAAGVGFALYNFTRALKSTSPSIFQNVTVSRITTSGTASEANISPDGKYVVYLEMAADGNRSLWVKQTATGDVLAIVPPTKGNILKHLSFSPDGNFVYYAFSDRVAPESLYRVSSIGGSPPKKVIADCQSPAAVSPDGKRLAFVRWEGNSKSKLMVANEDGTGERVVATLEGKDWFEGGGPTWSPDGRTIACAAGSFVGDGDEYRLVGVDAESGAIKELSAKRWAGAGRVVWMPDGAALVLVASESVVEDRSQVWRISYPSGEASRVTNDVQDRDRSSLGVTADGRTLVTVTLQHLSRIETIPAGGDTGRVARLTAAEASQEGFYGLAWTPQGRIVFSSFEDGQSDIRIMNADGSGRQRLTSDAFADVLPAVSPDGRYIVFASNRPEGKNFARLWRMDVDGGNLIQLTVENAISPHVSPDGRWVVYTSWSASEGMSSLWKVAIDGGEPARLTDYPASEPSYSLDGQWISCYAKADPAKPDDWHYSVIPVAGGRPVRQFDFPGFQYQFVRWTPDSRHLSFIGAPPDPSNIWLQPIDGGAPRKLTDFKTDYIFRHAWSRDGKNLFLVRGRPTSDVVLMKDTRL